ncbi:hypothetical protein L228DRAFT_242923 [Xylona heveae TC161]|uniref:Uncharacterized protein n=1 Tax=Xylona heveae (strain CBS 132557 / TC161) TaxID=1328760 RepID=A0A165JNA7_XYLHT|nr:hypothetical protein L228DRAFT_242923 [Xylona heveae TC161]KZF26446.1 hypothetical protein L228DRAFT_242923 [Xylona heveae TC161]
MDDIDDTDDMDDMAWHAYRNNRDWGRIIGADSIQPDRAFVYIRISIRIRLSVYQPDRQTDRQPDKQPAGRTDRTFSPKQFMHFSQRRRDGGTARGRRRIDGPNLPFYDI